MRGKSAHARLVRTALPTVPAETRHPEPPVEGPRSFPTADAVLGEMAITLAAFLLIALVLNLLVS